jgi:predicted nucleic acid-binding protein
LGFLVCNLKKASSLGVRGARIHDLMHAEAAIKYGANELLTLDDSGFATLNLSLQVAAP